MGVSIHYRGRIAGKHLLPDLIEELKEIVLAHGWDYHVYETEFPAGDLPDDEHDGKLYGISFVPPECEFVSITFLRNGRMSSPLQFESWGSSADETERMYLYQNSCKTQYAGVEIHKMIIGIFRYLAGHYLTDFDLVDEGGYWETGDEQQLAENFRSTQAMIDGFAAALRGSDQREGEDIDEYLERIIREFKNKNKAEGKDE